MSRVTILYDGWPLVYQPNQPAALHLLALLEHHPADIPAAVALPGEPAFALPREVEVHRAAARLGDFELLAWEQRTLLQLAEALHARLVHRTMGGPALLGARKALISPAEFGAGGWFKNGARSRGSARRHGSLAARLRQAAIPGGMGRARGLVWPTDLPPLNMDVPVFSLPPVVPRVFWDAGPRQSSPQRLELPQAFILYHGPYAWRDLRRMLDAWSWAAGSIGEDFPLVVLGLNDAVQNSLRSLAQEYGLVGTVRALPALALDDLAAVYRGCSALLHAAPVAPWGGPLRLALACGKPVVGLEDRLSDALVGSAAYLVGKGDTWQANSRALGAALVTVMVEASVADSLAAQAYQRAVEWKTSDPANFTQHLRAVYQLLAVS